VRLVDALLDPSGSSVEVESGIVRRVLDEG